MHIIVVGANQVGQYLIRLALDAGHDVVLIEADETRAEHCAQTYDAQVLHATIGEEDILDEAGADRADALIATTEDDSVNLMTMVLGQEYDIANLTSAVNARHRKPLFDRLGANTLVDPEILAARHLFDLVLHPGSERVTSLDGKGEIYELKLGADSECAGQSLGELNAGETLPRASAIVLIERKGKQVLPSEDTRLKAEDTLLVLSLKPLSQKQLESFLGSN